MKIVFLNIYQDLVNRGAETFVYEVARRLAKNHQVTVFQAGESEKPYQIKKVENIKPLPTDDQAFFWRIAHKFYLDPYSRQVFQFTKKVIPGLIRSNPDWVIALNGFWQLWQIKKIKAKSGFKILVSGQAGFGKDDYWNLKLRPDIFVALTNYQAKWAKSITKKVDIRTIPNGVDLNRFSQKIESMKLNLPKPIILCVAALVPYKNVDLTIKAVSKMDKTSLVILGQGPEHHKLNELCKKLLPKRHLITNVDFENIPAYYRSCDLFTLASAKSEAFGIAYLEALASGKAVVAPDDQPKREIIGDAGLFFKPKDPKDYSSTLSIAINKNWGDLPRQQAEKFDWDKIAFEYEKLMLENQK